MKVRRAGFTLIEAALALTLVVIIVHRGYRVLSTASRATAHDTTAIALEEKAQRLLERIARTIMEANRETLQPLAEPPFDTDDLQYQVHLGLVDGEIVWSDPEMIGLEEQETSLFWSRNPGNEAREKRVVWTDLVRPFLEGEVPNGVDDNGNGLVDERGLSFVIDRNAVTIRLTLQQQTEDGASFTQHVETTVTCRNLPPNEEEEGWWVD